jgi:hypothetical protein
MDTNALLALWNLEDMSACEEGKMLAKVFLESYLRKQRQEVKALRGAYLPVQATLRSMFRKHLTRFRNQS